MQFAAKEISKFMSKPEEQDRRAAKRLARHLKDHRRVALEYKQQGVAEQGGGVVGYRFRWMRED